MTLVFEAGAKADLDKRQIVFREQFFGSLYSLPHQELLRRHAGRFAEGACEMKLTEVGDGGYLGEAQVLFQIRGDEFFNAAKLMSRQSSAHTPQRRFRGAVMGPSA